MNPSRPRGSHSHELVVICAATDASPAVGSAAPEASPPLGLGRSLSPRRDTLWRRAPGRAAPASLPNRAADFIDGSSDLALLNFGLTPRHQPASDPLRQCPERRPCGCSLHPSRMETTDGTITEVRP